MRYKIDFKEKLIHLLPDAKIEDAIINLHKVLGDKLCNYEFVKHNTCGKISYTKDVYDTNLYEKTITFDIDIELNDSIKFLHKYLGDKIENYQLVNTYQVPRQIIKEVKQTSSLNSEVFYNNLIHVKFYLPSKLCAKDFYLKTKYVDSISFGKTDNKFLNYLGLWILKPTPNCNIPDLYDTNTEENYKNDLLNYKLLQEWFAYSKSNKQYYGKIEILYQTAKENKTIILNKCIPDPNQSKSNEDKSIIFFNYSINE